MNPEPPPTSSSSAQIRDLVHEVLTSDALPAIVQAGHPALRQRSAPFEGQLDAAELSALIGVMRNVMHAAPGVGLAAPQLGIPLQLAVLEDQFEIDEEIAAARGREPLEFFAVLNPSYTPLGAGTATFFEGCLSLSGLQALVQPAESVSLQYTAADEESSSRGFSGRQSRIDQHEPDHLYPYLYIAMPYLRSLTPPCEYAARWAEPSFQRARQELRFLPYLP